MKTVTRKTRICLILSFIMCLSLLASCKKEDVLESASPTEAQSTSISTESSENITEYPLEETTTEEETASKTQITTEAETETETETEQTTSESNDYLVIFEPRNRPSFRLVHDKIPDNAMTAEADMIAAIFRNYTGYNLTVDNSSKKTNKEIILSSTRRPETAQMLKNLDEGSYAIRVLRGEKNGDGKLLLATTTYASAYACIEYLMENYYSDENGLRIPYDLDITGSERNYCMIESNINKLRDPCIIVKDGIYYAYGTGWRCYKNTSGNLEGPWVDLGIVASVANPDTDGGSHWAPEVHLYNGFYYMFTTYLNSKTNHRGCIILKSDSPEGPFVEITNGHITPNNWDAIDGTFYVDPEGQPWMVFVHEWTCMPDGVGSFAAAKLSDDLTHFISEPIELFKANEPQWAVQGVTDGCWMYTTSDGELLMLWSNFDAYGYVIAVARSSNGRLDGEWIHEKTPLFSKYMTGKYDGGHAMIFKDLDGQMYLSFHSPNTAEDDRKEKPVFVPIKEEDGKIILIG